MPTALIEGYNLAVKDKAFVRRVSSDFTTDGNFQFNEFPLRENKLTSPFCLTASAVVQAFCIEVS
jgi:hypothetical protein